MERQEFNNEWKDTFNEAEVNPSEGVWTNIELDLEKAEGDKMKRRVLFYKLMAAASVVFGMCIAGAGGFYYGEHQATSRIAASTTLTTSKDVKGHNRSSNYIIDNNATATLKPNGDKEVKANQSVKSENKASSGLLADNNSNDDPFLIKSSGSLSKISDKKTEVNKKLVSTNAQSDLVNQFARSANNDNAQFMDKTSVDYASNENGYQDGNNLKGNKGQDHTGISASYYAVQSNNSEFEEKLPALFYIKKIELQLPTEEEQDPLAVMMARLEQREKELANDEDDKKEKKEKGDEQLWTSLGLAAGSFNPSNTSVKSPSANSFSASNKVADNQSKASGNTYSMGLNVGTKISSRWIVQGGVNYLKQSSAYQANAVVGTPDLQNFRAASLNDLTAKADSKSDKLVGTADYNVNNSLQFVSVPVQAGYVALNRTIGIQINAGISTDLFIQNTIAPENSNLEKVTQGRGNESPYRPVNFSGLFGTELSYRIGKHYRLALNPGLRYPINSIYKSNTGVSSNPLSMDVGMRFRYIFH